MADEEKEKPLTPLPQKDADELYTHTNYLGRIGETPKEKATREALNDAGKRLEALQKGNTKEKKSRAESALYDNPRSKTSDE